ncbi:hypothetical protein [Nocardiopsis quinghaiensis]|uniref:hypothetical protein n=1 Tax=Nocardiopsis quinghaiensis TaxID=464995 RepID=UPI00123B0412|nr:hypothetical protein [Nocardiopsis quinghaiensis]
MSAAGQRSAEKAMRAAYTSPEGYHGPDSPRRESERERLVEEVADALPQEPPRGCRVEGCEEPHEARHRCKKHYAKWWRLREMRRPPPEDGPALAEVVAECRAAYAAVERAVGDG